MADFEDGKDDTALRTIGEVSEALNIKPHVLRYWEQQFSLLTPLKRSGGRRYYRADDVALVERINRLVNEEGYTLKGAEAVLRSARKGELDRRKGGDRRSGDRRVADAGGQMAQMDRDIDPAPRDNAVLISKLKSLRERLAGAIDA